MNTIEAHKAEAMGKARESGRKTAEGGKQFRNGTKEMLLGIFSSLRAVLGCETSKLKAKYYQSKLDKGKIPDDQKDAIEKSIQENTKNAKDKASEAKKQGRRAFSGFGQGFKGFLKTGGYGAKSLYHLADAGDATMQMKVEKRNTKKEGKK